MVEKLGRKRREVMEGDSGSSCERCGPEVGSMINN